MPFGLASMTRAKSGAYSVRKAIPADVRPEYKRLFGLSSEATLTLPPTMRPQEAKARQAEFLATIERRIQAIREGNAGRTRPLSERQALALAGEWYRWYVGQHEDNPGSPERWEDLGERLAELMDHAHSVVINKDDPDDDSKIQIDPKEWRDSRHWITQDSGADRFLADKGLALTPEAYDLFLYRVAWEL
jgi:hypothetical protein